MGSMPLFSPLSIFSGYLLSMSTHGPHRIVCFACVAMCLSVLTMFYTFTGRNRGGSRMPMICTRIGAVGMVKDEF
jgi:hypothetical protein